MSHPNLFAVKNLNKMYTDYKKDGNDYYNNILCFRAPPFLSTGALGILDADYWLRTIKKDKPHPLVADIRFPYTQIPIIDESDLELRKGNLVKLKCDLTERAFEQGRFTFIGANEQGRLFELWNHISDLCSQEGFNLVQQDWESYKNWSKRKFEEISGRYN